MREAQAGAQIVLLPETAFIGVKEDLDPIITKIKELAKTEKIYIAFGKILMDADQADIYMTIVDPSGEIVLDHFKYAYNMGLDYSQVELQTVDTPYGRLSGVLCGDLDNPGIIKQASRKGVDIMLVPAADGPEETFWHFRLAAFRAVENGFSLVRSAMGGVSLATDPYGRTLASMDYYKTSDHVMTAQVPIHRAQTLFGMVGDWFGWLMVIGFIGMAGWAIYCSVKYREPKA